MIFSKINGFLLTSFFLFTTSQIFAQKTDSLVVNSLNSQIRPITTLVPENSFNDISYLSETLKAVEVIALGEVTHGTAEVFQYRDRLVRFLVTNLGYRAIAFEGDFIALEYIDRYINGKTDSLEFKHGTALISTNRLMIEWLRKYNHGKAELDKVHVYGMEARGFSGIINRIIEVMPSIEASDKIVLQKIRDKEYGKIQKQEINELKAILVKLRKLEGPEINKCYIELLNQIVYGYYETTKRFRDHAMASNVIWLKERAKDNKLILWAHNGHVAKGEPFKVPAMGNHLYKKYGSKYFVVATDFNHGKAYVNVYGTKNKSLLGFQSYYYPEVNSNDSYEYYFKQCKFRNFIIDIDAALKHPVLNRFFVKPLSMRMIGALSSPANWKLSIAENFNMVVYFDETTSEFVK